jgi:beta-xylosidase
MRKNYSLLSTIYLLTPPAKSSKFYSPLFFYPMKKKIRLTLAFLALLVQAVALAQAKNPIIFADVPDMSMIRVGKNYYMSSTTMHMNPGVPIMKSTDLVNWKIINYAYDTLADLPALNLTEGKNIYSRGSWASSLRYHNGMYYVTTFAHDIPGETYIFKTKDIEKGNWERVSFKPSLHDHSLFFDDDGKTYLIYGADRLKIVELNEDLTGIKQDVPERVLIENASEPTGKEVGLAAEGSQLFKVKGKYYLFNICAPRREMRTVIIHRADNINGPWEGKVGLQDRGIAQGGLIDTPDGRWFSYLFRDYAAVGRVPYLVPVKWEDGWPVLGDNGKVPETLDLPANKGLIPNLVASDEFNRKKGQAALPLVWQWNHNPDNALWSVTERKGFLRLKTGRIDTDFLHARNTLTQRTIGPTSSASVALDVSKMKEGDFAGLSALQKEYGLVGVKIDAGQKSIVMITTDHDKPVEVQRIPLDQNQIYFKIDCDFTGMNDAADSLYTLNGKDEATFFYSLDGKVWKPIGRPLKMKYSIPHFMGYRFGLFNYATKETGGYADFDWFRIK